jgi:hypothetical protein
MVAGTRRLLTLAENPAHDDLSVDIHKFQPHSGTVAGYKVPSAAS